MFRSKVHIPLIEEVREPAPRLANVLRVQEIHIFEIRAESAQRCCNYTGFLVACL
jgi:hypothetical protein